jgi:thiol-disulfide isomerase/thioredoxin
MLRGNVVLLDFWATWCSPCVAEIPSVINLAARFEPSGLKVLAIHSQSGIDKLPEFLRQRPYRVPIGLDATGDTQRLYGVYGWPTYVLIDKKGVIRFRGSSLPSEDLVEQLLTERPGGLTCHCTERGAARWPGASAAYASMP